MASVAENVADGFTIQRLRGMGVESSVGMPWLSDNGNAQLRASTGDITQLPPPIVLAQGRTGIVGPSSAVGASEYWNVGLPIPAMDVQWVVTQSSISTFSASAATNFIKGVVWPVGDASAGDAVRGPALSVDDFTGVIVPAVSRVSASVPRWRGQIGTWIPIDPSRTVDGFHVQVTLLASSSGVGINAARLDASGIVLLGYPVNTQGTAALWQSARYRG